MNKYSIFGLLLASLAASNVASAQDLDQAKKAIHDEQYDKAKAILKSLVEAKPNEGKNFYYLGDLFLFEGQVDSSKYYFNKGLAAKNKPSLNYIGLGQLALENNNAAEAKTNFAKAEKEIKKRDNDELLLIAKANINAAHPNAAEAIIVANKVIANDVKNAEAYLVLGNAHLLNKNFNEAYSNYRNAFDYDNSLLEAKLQLAVITKRAKAFKDAIEGFQEILVLNPNYAPAYREMAETYQLWANNSSNNSKEYLGKALENYKKYMTLSEGSVESRLKYADFLLLTQDYKALETEAQDLKNKENVNPRIFRYLGYSAYENGKYEESVNAIHAYLKKADSKKVIGRDYLYLGLAQIALSKNAEGSVTNEIEYQLGLDALARAIEVEPAIASEFNQHALKLFKAEKYAEAAKIFAISAKEEKQSNYMYDNFYLGYALYFQGKDAPDAEVLKRASDAFAKTIAASPTTQEAYLFKARANRYIDTPESREVMNEAYLGYIKAVQDKAQLNAADNKDNLVEAYMFVGAHYANTDVDDKAIEYLNKVIQLDPSNVFAKQTLAALKK